MEYLPSDIMKRLRTRLEHLYGEDIAARLLERLGLLVGRYMMPDGVACDETCSSWDQRDSLLITYGDMLTVDGEKPLVTLHRFLNTYLRNVIHGVHILPFYPYSSDDGFSVIDYRKVDESLGDWGHIAAIGQDFRLMVDLVLNHVSSESEWFRQYQNGIAPARGYFISLDPETDIGSVTRPRTSPLLTLTQTPRGERWVWTTFSADQIDLDFSNQDVLFEFLDILLFYVRQGARIIRLDAIAYLWKQLGTSCVNLPETHEIVKLLRDVLDLYASRVLLLTETNLPQEENISYFGQGDEAQMVYQFSLPPLLLHALLTGTTRYLSEWAAGMQSPPAGCTYLNFTASHDGIGVRPLEGLVPDAEIRALVEAVQRRGGHVSSRTDAEGRESPYELNITYFDALSDPYEQDTDQQIARFLCSQTVMLSLRGIPAIYFHSLTGSGNDYEGVARSGHARSINRRRWNARELATALNDPASHTSRVFHEYVRRIKIRSEHPAFHPDGLQHILDLEDGLFGIERRAPGGQEIILAISNMSDKPRVLPLQSLLSGYDAGSWFELIDRGEVYAAQESMELEPYASYWFCA